MTYHAVFLPPGDGALAKVKSEPGEGKQSTHLQDGFDVRLASLMVPWMSP